VNLIQQLIAAIDRKDDAAIRRILQEVYRKPPVREPRDFQKIAANDKDE
jgi:hypothetical protein